MKTFYAIALSSILLVAAISGAQVAMANPGHVVTYPNAPLPPKNIQAGGTMPAQIAVPTGQIAPVAGTVISHIFDGGVPTFTGFSVNNFLCQQQATGLLGVGLAAGDIQSVLVDLGSPRAGPVPFEPVGAYFQGQGIGGPLIGTSLTLGPNAPVATPIGGVVVFYLPFSPLVGTFALPPPSANFVVPPMGPIGWFQLFGPNPGSTTANIANAVVSTQNILGACGCDDFGLDGTCTPGTDADGVSSESYIVDISILGEIIPIDTSALLIAGIASGSMMILPVLGVVAVGAFGILRFVVKRN